VARLHPVKGHIYLLEAAALAARKIPGLRVMIVGTGPDRPGLEEAASRLGINRNIIFTGFRKDIPEVISSLNCLVLPSLSEGLSLTVMEGMAMKKPVIATAVGGTPEIITPGQDGLLVPPADVPALAEAIVRVVSDPEPARKMAEEARRTIEERFTAGLMAEKTAGLYRNLLCLKGH
jgi:glycosyltransferase involved in cell wall biosynthesis